MGALCPDARPWPIMLRSSVGAASFRSVSTMPRALKIAVPNKGRLSDEAVRLLNRAGIHLRGSSDRKLFASVLDGRIQVLYLRAQDIPGFVAEGSIDAGITGFDVVEESGYALHDRLDLGFGRCRLVLAVPEDHPTGDASGLPEGARIATSFPSLTQRYFESLGKSVHITAVSGACEVAPTLGVAEAITDLTSTGSTLAMNHLREVGTLLESTCRFITAPRIDPEVAEEMERVESALASVVAAQDKRYLMADLPRAALDEVRTFLPGLAGPTVVEIAGNPDMVAIQVVVDEADIFDAVHRLRRIGGRGILVVPIDRLIP